MIAHLTVFDISKPKNSILQLDVFRLEAVHLGPLRSVIVGHDGLARGAGWYLKQVTVREKEEDMDDKAWIFHCNRWAYGWCFGVLFWGGGVVFLTDPFAFLHRLFDSGF